MPCDEDEVPDATGSHYGRTKEVPVPKIGKMAKTKRDTDVLKGLRRLMGYLTALEIAGETLTEDEIRARIQRHIDAMVRVRDATIALRTAVQEERAIERSLRPFLVALKQVAKARVGRHHVRMVDLGFKPDKKPYTSAATKKRANEKRQKTREERGIIGKRRRAKMRG
jgi:hypothetical protein